MSNWWLWLLLAGLLVEFLIAWALWSWKSSLDYYQQRIDRKQRYCYACVTGASVMSFSDNSSTSFCPEHKAHYMLIRDLEAKAATIGSPDGDND